MLALLPAEVIPDGLNQGETPLANLNLQAPDNWAVALVKAWAVVGDIITFYQERVANEGYLGTASEPVSVQEMAWTLGYQRRPAVAPGAYLAVQVADSPGPSSKVFLPAGTPVLSIPGSDGPPQTFETQAPFEMCPEWNALAPAARPRPPEPTLTRNASTVRLRGVSTGLSPGDPLLLFLAGTEPGAARSWRVCRVKEIQVQQTGKLGITQVTLDALGRAGDVLSEQQNRPHQDQVFRFRRQVKLFGYNAPEWNELPQTVRRQYGRFEGGVFVCAPTVEDASLWRQANAGLPAKDIPALLVADSGTLLAATAGRGVFRSTDGGDNWQAGAGDTAQPSAGGLPRQDVRCLAQAPQGQLFAGTRSGAVFRSTDGGAHWNPLEARPPKHGWRGARDPAENRLPRTTVHTLVATVHDQRVLLLAGTGNGVFRADDAGSGWQPVNGGLPGTHRASGMSDVVVRALSLGADAREVLAGTDHGVFRTTDHGKHWKAWNRGLPPLAGAHDLAKLTVYALLRVPDGSRGDWFAATNLGLFRSAESQWWHTGPVWSRVSTLSDGTTLLPVRALAAGRAPTTHGVDLLAGTARGVFRSGGRGATWSPVARGPGRREILALAAGSQVPVVAASPFGGIVEKQWPGFHLEEGTVDLSTGDPRIVAGGWVVLEEATPKASRVEPYRIAAATTDYRRAFRRHGMSTRIRIESGTDPGNRLPQFGLRDTRVLAESEELALAGDSGTVDPVAGDRIELALPLSEPLNPGHRLILRSRTRQGEAESAPGGEIVEVARSIAGVAGDPRTTHLQLKAPLRQAYDPSTVTLHGNVAFFVRGRSIRRDVLGGGDTGRANQRFTLHHSPVTHTRTPRGGVDNAVEIRVDDIAWRRVQTLLSEGPRSRSYELRVDHRGQTQVVFGDGEHGARLPSGHDNVVASYRSDRGPTGPVEADTLRLLQGRLPGVGAVTNPLPAFGAEPPETTAEIRLELPRSVRTLGRVVSLDDYASFALTFPGIEKARAVGLWNGHAHLVQLTVAASEAKSITRSSALCDRLIGSIHRVRVPGPSLRLDLCVRLLFDIDATVCVVPGHSSEDIERSLKSALLEAFGFDRRGLGQDVAASEVIAVIQEIDGVAGVSCWLSSAGERDTSAKQPAGPPPLLRDGFRASHGVAGALGPEEAGRHTGRALARQSQRHSHDISGAQRRCQLTTPRRLRQVSATQGRSASMGSFRSFSVTRTTIAASRYGP